MFILLMYFLWRGSPRGAIATDPRGTKPGGFCGPLLFRVSVAVAVGVGWGGGVRSCMMFPDGLKA